MRDYLLFYLNGQRCRITGETAFVALSDFLRGPRRLVGTKVVCAEGDCGACTVLLGRPDGDRLRYETANSCIQFLYQLDCKHVVTVEGLNGDGRLTPVQEAMIACHGSQCGFCTPGFVVSLTGLLEQNARVDEDALRLGLTGNLCRCTGYQSIIQAGLSIAPETVRRLGDRYGSREMLADLSLHSSVPVLIETEKGSSALGPPARTFFSPRRLEDALEFKSSHPEALLVSGNTELGVLRNKKGFDPPELLSLTHVPQLSNIDCENDHVGIGANVTWTQMEHFAKGRLPELHKIIIRFGSPQIRNVATLIANVANGSPIADALPFLFICGAEVELTSWALTRRVPIDHFYKGYKIKDLAADEIITKVIVPLPAADELLKLYKVSRRNDLDIATFGAGIRVKHAGDVITRAFVAYSGVGPKVLRLPHTEAFLQGKRFLEETFAEAGKLARTEVAPISDVRGSRDFRLQLAENVLTKFYFDCQAELHYADAAP